MKHVCETFIESEDAAITVDWVVLSAAAVAMAIAATDVISGGLDTLTSNLESQLRTQQISDAFVLFVPDHFDKMYDEGWLSEEDAEAMFDGVNSFTNAEILTLLDLGISEMQAGNLDEVQLAATYALASVADQRNIIEDSVVDTYFGDGSEGSGFTGPIPTVSSSGSEEFYNAFIEVSGGAEPTSTI